MAQEVRSPSLALKALEPMCKGHITSELTFGLHTRFGMSALHICKHTHTMHPSHTLTQYTDTHSHMFIYTLIQHTHIYSHNSCTLTHPDMYTIHTHILIHTHSYIHTLTCTPYSLIHTHTTHTH